MAASDLSEAKSIVDRLRGDSEKPSLTGSEIEAQLSKLKILCRDKNTATGVYTKEGFGVVCRYAFEKNTKHATASLEALRCVANALLLVEGTREFSLELDVAPKVVDRLNCETTEEEFILSRILFLVSYSPNSKPMLERTLDDDRLGEALQTLFSRHARRVEKGKGSSPMDDMALVETLKLVFNLTYFVPTRANSLSSIVPDITLIFTMIPLEDFPLVPPVAPIINSLINFTLTAEMLKPDPVAVTSRAVEILDKATSKKEYLEPNPRHDFDESGSPLLTLLKRLAETNSEDVRKFLDDKFLPKPEDREKAIGRGNSLRDRLLRFTTSGNSANTKDLILSVFFDISNRDAAQLVENIGYGYASGFLFSNDIPVPENATGAKTKPGSEGVNPVTGQTWEAEAREHPGDPFEGMTDEEKEREAERLFVLFERLKKTGIVDVTNPVEQAIREGRFEELD